MIINVYVSPEQFKRMMDGKNFTGRSCRTLGTDTVVQLASTRVTEVTEYSSFVVFTLIGGN
ncbi:hypothetical protein D3C75_158800 [compost metagenome]